MSDSSRFTETSPFASQLDELDRQIVDALRHDGRIPFRALGDQIGLSANATADRVRGRLRRGVITQFTAVVDERPLRARSRQ